MHQHPTGLGDGGVQQVGAHGGGRVNAEPQQDRGHQGAPADTGHADDKTNDQACNYETNVTHIHHSYLRPCKILAAG